MTEDSIRVWKIDWLEWGYSFGEGAGDRGTAWTRDGAIRIARRRRKIAREVRAQMDREITPSDPARVEEIPDEH